VVQKNITKESHLTAKMFSFSSSDGLVQNCVILLQWFTHKVAAFYTEQCTSPSLFTTLKSHKAVEPVTEKLGLH